LSDADLEGYWWLVWPTAYQEGAVAFAGMRPSLQWDDRGYLCRVGVLPWHRGHGLQRRLLRVREAKARRLGWTSVHTDTTDNIPSSNSLIKAGYTLFRPALRWGPHAHGTLYWRKALGNPHRHSEAPAHPPALEAGAT
jgi:GNAT superfamily N-acetyltransferase